jgi:NADP-dependent alcohol dehydrogenase
LEITEGSIEEKAKLAIEKTREFYESLGIQTRLRDYTEDYEGFAAKAAKALEKHGLSALGEYGDVTPTDAEKIIEMAY